MTDFSKTLIHASSIYGIMVNDNGNGKSPMEKYIALSKEIEERELEYSTYDEKKREQKKSINFWNKTVEMKLQLDELEKRKDDEPELSVGCKSFLLTVYAAEKYGKWSTFKDKGNKYTTKGKMAEEEAITLLSRLHKRYYVKNDQRIENEWVSGIPDIIIASSYEKADKIIDIKCPYDVETFFGVLGKELIGQYKWQVLTYMWLTGADEGEVAYLLMNTPEYILNYERKRLFDRMEVVTEEDAEYKKAADTLVNNLTFDDMPIEDRKISFFVERDEKMIEKIPKRVEKCREWLVEIEKMHLTPSEVDVLVENVDVV